MARLKLWQWIVLALPITAIVIFLLVAAGSQIHTWGINWIWAIFILVFVDTLGYRYWDENQNPAYKLFLG